MEKQTQFIEKIFDDIYIRRQNKSEPAHEQKDDDADQVGKFKGIITITDEVSYNKVRD